MKSPKSILHRLLVVAVALGAVTTACSLVVSNDTVQCSTDNDCKGHAADAVCRSGVCVSPGAAAADGSTATCTPKTPTSQLDILNEPCTNSSCIPFDDCVRSGLCNDASLPALLPPGDGGVR